MTRTLLSLRHVAWWLLLIAAATAFPTTYHPLTKRTLLVPYVHDAPRPVRGLSLAAAVRRRRRLYSQHDGALNPVPHDTRPTATVVATCASSIAWTTLAILALRHHPDPRFAHCSLQHNLLTMSQALLFPLGILWTCTMGAVVTPRTEEKQWLLSAGLAWTYVQLAVTTLWAPVFCFGYDLYPPLVKYVASGVFGGSAGVAVWSAVRRWQTRSVTSSSARKQQRANKPLVLLPDRNNWKQWLYSVAAMGFGFFSLLPLCVDYPRATIPTILGKRLSRPATAFHWLGCTAAWVLHVRETSTDTILSRGLAVSSGLHIVLILAKLAGVDDGGLLLPGRGLWEVYPAMMAVPWTLAASLLVHLCPVVAVWL